MQIARGCILAWDRSPGGTLEARHRCLCARNRCYRLRLQEPRLDYFAERNDHDDNWAGQSWCRYDDTAVTSPWTTHVSGTFMFAGTSAVALTKIVDPAQSSAISPVSKAPTYRLRRGPTTV